MIEIANQRFRNLQEQVAWLTLMINRATDIVKNIAGTAPDVASLAPASTYSNGTTFAIGTAAPYDYYVALNGNWVELGTMPLAGPAGTNGTNGYNVLLTSQATTSSTSFIHAASIYDPDSRGWKVGDLILSEQGDVFVVNAAGTAGAYVVYRFNIMGPTGPQGATGQQGTRGATLFEGSDIAYSSGSYSWDSSDWPAGKNPMPGDLYIIASDYTDGGHSFSEGDVFVVTSVLAYGAQLSYSLSLRGPQGAPGQDGDVGSLFYSGTDLTYDALGLQVEALLSDVPLRVDDYYLVTADYTDNGHDFYLGDVYVCTAVSASTADLSYVANIRGPQGAAGADGTDGTDGTDGADGAQIILSSATTTSSTTTIAANTMTAYLHPPTVGDVVISASGDVFLIASVGGGGDFNVTYETNIKGASGASAWGSITGTLADQTDLKSALDGKLSLSGGTMTGTIEIAPSSTNFALSFPDGTTGDKNIIGAGTGNSFRILSYQYISVSNRNVYLGTSGNGFKIQLRTAANDVVHNRFGNTYVMLDAYNTKANESGGTTPLNELTLAGTKYKVLTAAGGFTFSVSGSQGAFDLYVMGYISGEYGLHHLTKSSSANIYRNGTDTGAKSITIANASFIIPKSADTTGLDSATGDAYTAAGVSAAYIDWGGTYKNQQLHLDSNYTIVFAS